MIDTNKELFLLQYFHKNQSYSSSELFEISQKVVSLITIKRYLKTLTQLGYLQQFGAGRSVKYCLSKKGILLRGFDLATYIAQNPDSRMANTSYWFELFSEPYIQLLSSQELASLNKTTERFRKAAQHTDSFSRNKEIMRFIVEFSWKTSQIEGNTYDLLSTEKLLIYGEKSPIHTQYEAQMIMNQKKALEFIFKDMDAWRKPNITLLEALHTIVSEKLDITKNFRKTLVGITGTSYKPLENEYQIKEAVVNLFNYINLSTNIYDKAMLATLGLSYIQPFADGNKRTARLLANAILMSENYAPISYRSIDDKTYKEASLLFYEQNSIIPFKKLFIEQYVFSANNYNIAGLKPKDLG